MRSRALGGVLGGAGAGALEVVEGGAGVVQGVAGPAVVLEEEGDVVAGLPGAVGVAAGLLVLDGLLVVVQGLAGVPGLTVDDAELVVGGGEVFGVVGGDQAQGLLVAVQGGVEVAQEHRLGCAGGAGLQEPLVGDDGQRSEGLGPADPVVLGPEVEAVLVPVVGLVQVPQAGHVQVGVAEAERERGFLGCGRRSAGRG